MIVIQFEIGNWDRKEAGWSLKGLITREGLALLRDLGINKKHIMIGEYDYMETFRALVARIQPTRKRACPVN